MPKSFAISIHSSFDNVGFVVCSVFKSCFTDVVLMDCISSVISKEMSMSSIGVTEPIILPA